MRDGICRRARRGDARGRRASAAAIVGRSIVPTGSDDAALTGSLGHVREWLVAGALVEAPDGVLLVRNRRRGGWIRLEHAGRRDRRRRRRRCSTGLTREVEEETGLASPRGRARSTRCAPSPSISAGRCAPRSIGRSSTKASCGSTDPDGIVVEARSSRRPSARGRLAAGCPLGARAAARVARRALGPSGARGYRYDVRGTQARVRSTSARDP